MALNLKEEKHFYVGKIPFDLFKSEILIYVDKEKPDFDFAEKCSDALNSMGEKLIAELCTYTVHYCNSFCDGVGETPPKIKEVREILQYVRPTTLVVEHPQDEDIVIHLECNCDWEEEHGLEWLIKGNKVLYVGAYNGESPYMDDEKYNRSWNYVYYQQQK